MREGILGDLAPRLASGVSFSRANDRMSNLYSSYLRVSINHGNHLSDSRMSAWFLICGVQDAGVILYS